MTKKKKPKPFQVVTEIKTMARERIGIPPGEKVVPNKKRLAKYPRQSKRALSEDEETN